MAESRAAYRYARAMFETAEEKKAVDRVSEDFELIEKLIKSSHDFLLFLRSPVVNAQRKKTIMTELWKNRLSDITFEFILLLVSKNRETILPEIIQRYYLLRDERLGIENVIVKSAVELTKEVIKTLSTRLEQITRKKVRLHPVIDRRLKGGLAVQIGDTVWDGSITRQLEILRDRFIKGVTV